MHYRLEIIMPPTEDIEGAISEIMSPFDENMDPDDGENCLDHSFWDWWVIGGRWSGSKLTDCFDQDKKEKFFQRLRDLEIKVHGVVCGKQDIVDEHIEIVDKAFKEFFPESGFEHCPFFGHAGSRLAGDIMRFGDVNLDKVTASRVIFAGPGYKDKLKALEMYQTEFWNGVSFCKAEWRGSLSDALKMYMKYIYAYKEETKNKITPKEDWLCVTVDYHS